MNWFLTPLARSSYQGAIVIGVIWLLCRIFERRLPASVRCTLWRLAYIKLFLGLVIAGAVAMPLLHADPAVYDSPVQVVAAALEQTTIASRPSTSIASASATAAPIPAPQPGKHSSAWRAVVAALYFIGVAICVFRLACAGLRSRHILRAARPIDAAAHLKMFAELADRFELRTALRLLESADVAGPTYVSRAILLPSGSADESSVLSLILAHELAHARRRDLVYEWLGVIAQTLFYFHPLVYLARREERLARESAADALALRITGAPAAALGALLLELALKPKSGPKLVGAMGVLEGRTLLHRRLAALKEAATLSTNRKFALLPLAALLLLVPWYVTRARRKPLPPNVDFIRHSAALPDIPHGDHSIVGQIRDDGGNPPGDVIIQAVLLRKDQSFPYPYEGQSRPMRMIHADAKGKYELTALPEGHYGLMVMDSAAFRTDWDLRHHTSAVGRFAPTTNEVAIKPGERVKTLNLTASRGATISGRILDRASGLPVPNVLVETSREGSNGVTEEGGDAAETNPDGHYILRCLPGQVSLVVKSFGKIQSRVQGKVFNLSLGQNASYDFRVTPPSP